MERGADESERASASERRSTRLLTLMAWLVSSVWIIALVPPVADALASRPAGRVALSLAGVALFLAIYLWATGADAREFAMTETPAPQPLWLRALPAALITALALAMTLGLDTAWDTLFIFAVVTAARRLPIRPALVATALLCLLPVDGSLSHGVPFVDDRVPERRADRRRRRHRHGHALVLHHQPRAAHCPARAGAPGDHRGAAAFRARPA